MFDKAMERLYKEKASNKDLRGVQFELSENRSSSLFADMRDLFDTTVKNLNERIDDVQDQSDDNLKKII